MIASKINLPDEIVIEIQDAKFTFSRPSNLDQFDFPEAFEAIKEDQNPSKFFSYRIKYVLAKLKKIEGIKFEEEDREVGKTYFKDLSPDLQLKVTLDYYDKCKGYFNRGSELKKDQEPSELPGSLEQD